MLALALVAAALVSANDPAFTLLEDYTGEGFFRGFDFFHAHDPTDGQCCASMR